MKNPLQNTYSGVTAQISQARTGVDTYAAALGLSLVDEATMTATLEALLAGESASKLARVELSNRTAAVNTLMGSVKSYIFAARDSLKPRLGKEYSAAWIEAGFVDSLAVPRTVEKVLPVLHGLKTYFTAHPTHEIASLNITAAAATLFYDNLEAGRDAVNSQTTAWQLAMATRDTKMEQARGFVRALIKELTIRLDPMDGRWASFGFNKPGQLQMPAVPGKVSAMTSGPGVLLVKWDKAARAKTYRVWKQVVGVDPQLVLVGSSSKPGFTIEGLPSGVTVEIYVSAMNNGGESQKTEKVTVVTA